MDFNYSKLRNLDIFGSTDTKLISLAWPIKMWTAGWKKAFSDKCASHSGFIVEESNLFWAYEATSKGFTRNSLKEYLNEGNGRKIVSIKRFGIFNELVYPDICKKAKNLIIDLAFHQVKYDWKDVVKLITSDQNSDFTKLYCSESVEFILRVAADFSINGFTKKAVDPYDIQMHHIGCTDVLDFIKP